MQAQFETKSQLGSAMMINVSACMRGSAATGLKLMVSHADVI